MKKNLFLRLCLTIVLGLSFSSCRQDIHEQETYNNSSAFQLTSKRISLNEAKHKAKLLPELGEVEAEFKAKTKNSAFGKTVNYGNGVSIDTDDVIYIENGPNYYTYTFRINRENAPADAPVENLVLSPLSDGTYRELLVSYNLTSQEKQQLNDGLFVDLTGKVISQELASGTYGTNLTGKTTSTQCHWESATVNVKCPCEGHTLGQECTCPKGKPLQYVITWNVCEEVEDAVPTAGSPESGGSSGGGGTGTLTPPCDENGISSQPQDPSSTLGNQPCGNGTPTLPNLSLSNPEDIIPCNKLKNLLDPTKGNIKPLIINGMYSFLDNIGNKESETGIYLKKSSIGKITAEIAPPSGDNTLPPKYNDNYFSEIHTHPSTTYPMFSYSDIYVMYVMEIYAADHNAGLSSMLLVCEDTAGVKQTYAIVFEDSGTMMEAAWANTPENAGCSKQQLIKQMDASLKLKYDEESEKSNPNYERAFLQFNFGKNIGLYKANSDLTNWSKLTISENSDTAVVTATNCN